MPLYTSQAPFWQATWHSRHLWEIRVHSIFPLACHMDPHGGFRPSSLQVPALLHSQSICSMPHGEQWCWLLSSTKRAPGQKNFRAFPSWCQHSFWQRQLQSTSVGMYDFVHSWYLIMTNYSLFFFFQNASHRCLDFNFQWPGLGSYFSSSFYSCFSKHHLLLWATTCTQSFPALSAADEKSPLTQGQRQEAPSSGGSCIYVVADTHASLCFRPCHTVHSW